MGIGWGYPGYYAGGYPWYYGDSYYGGSYYGDDGSSQPDSAGEDGNGYSAQVSPQQQQEQDEIDRLNDEVARLRGQQQSGNQPQAKTAIHTKTVLVFQDKHTEEVQNYAIIGPTLWVFDAQQARKIRVTDLDIPATKKANEDRGMDFQLPVVGAVGQPAPHDTEAQPSRTNVVAPGIGRS